MSFKLQRHARGLLCGALISLSWVTWSGTPIEVPLGAQAAVGKKPLSYDAYDAWWAIQGTTLSRDGKWLAYALTSQGLDGQLVVRNLDSGQEFRHPRGTSPSSRPTAGSSRSRSPRRRRKKRRSGCRARPRRRGRERARRWAGTWRRQYSAAHQRRHHDAGDRTGRDLRAHRHRQHAGGIVFVGGAASRPRRRWRRARRARRCGGRTAAVAARAEPPAGGRWRAGRRSEPRARPAPSARTTAPISIIRNLATGQDTTIRSSPTSRGRATAPGWPTRCRRPRPRKTARSPAR